jgi:hypothetical protein
MKGRDAMMTVRHIERLYQARSHRQLLQEMLAGRAENSLRLANELDGHLPAAAMALVRLDELEQSHVPLYRKLLNLLLAAQEPDGGWGDPLTTAICLRALSAGHGHGLAIQRALTYLAQMQKPEGIWPQEPLRRLPADAFVSAYILLQLGSDPRFREAVRFDDAMNWFAAAEHKLDAETRRLWDHVAIRSRMHRAISGQEKFSWS